MRINITPENIILPFKTLLDPTSSSIPFMPDVSEETDTVPGVDGEKQLSARYGSSNHILVMRSGPDLWPEEKEALIRDVEIFMAEAKKSVQELHYERFSRTYKVKFVGAGEKPREYATWLEFRLTLKAHDPLGYEDFERLVTSIGVADNKGNEPAPAKIEFTGPLTNPRVMVSGIVYSYTGAVPNGSVLVADAESQVAYLRNAQGVTTNANKGWNGNFLTLRVGPINNIESTTAANQFAVKWTNRWA